MRILNMNIQSFGKWVDKRINLEDQTNFHSFYGENESGKSTVQTFILYMFFGLAKKSCEFYTPKSRAHIAGEMTLSSGDEVFTLSRQDTSCTVLLQDGTETTEDWWKQKLKGMNHTTYQAIYAFAQSDLLRIKDMNENELSDILISVGLTGSTTLYQTEKRLQSELDALFKPRGKNPLLNQEIQAYQALEKKYEAEVEKEKPYHEDMMQIKKKASELRRLMDEKERLAETIESTRLKLQYFDDIESYHLTNLKFNAYKEVPKFPENGLNRWQEVAQQLMPLHLEKESKFQAISRAQIELEENLSHQLPHHKIKEIKNLKDEETNYYKIKDKLEGCREDETIKKNQLQTILKALNWTENLSRNKPINFHLKTYWQELIQEEDQLINSIDELERQSIEISQAKEEKEDKIKELAAKRLTRAEEIEYENLIQSCEKNAVLKNSSSSKAIEYTSYFILCLALISLISAIVIPQNVFYFFAGVLLGVGIFIYLQEQKRQPLKNAAIEKAENQRQLAQEILEEQSEWIDTIKQLELERDYHIKQYKALENKLKAQHEKYTDHQTKIDAEQRLHPYLKNFQLAYWLDVYEKIKAIDDLESELEELSSQQKKYSSTLTEIEDRFRAIEDADNFAELKELYANQLLLQKEVKKIKETIETLEKDKQALIQEINLWEKQQNQLLEFAGVTSEETFFIKEKDYQIYHDLKEQLNRLTIKLSHVFDPSELSQFKHKLMIKDELKKKQSDHLLKMDEIKKEAKQMETSLNELKVKVTHLEKQEDLSILNFQKQIAEDEINQLARTWAIKSTELNIIQVAKRQYQDKYLEKVMDYTTKYFSELTHQHYIKVFAPSAGQLFQVEDQSYLRYNVNELSQGTIDQLYISLRLAIATVMNATHRLPILVDDAFVHFDDYRLDKGLSLLKKASESQQVLFFTCKLAIRQKLNSKTLVDI